MASTAPLTSSPPVTPLAFAPLVQSRADKQLPPLDSLAFHYPPSFVAACIARFPEIVALGLNPYTARGLVRPMVETRDAPRLPMKSKHFHGDALTWAGLVADIERAWMALLGDYELPERRLRYNIVGLRMQGLRMSDIGRQLGVRWQVVLDEHKQAVLLMALVLGYEEPTTPE